MNPWRLTDPYFPTGAQTAQGTSRRPVQIDPGSHDVDIHAWPANADGFDLDCRRLPTIASANVNLAVGDRLHLIVYAEKLGAPTHLPALPVGG